LRPSGSIWPEGNKGERMAIAGKPVVYQGETAWFRQVDLAASRDATALVPVEHDLEALGFELLGDFICSALTAAINRVWVHRALNVQATLLVRYVDEGLQILCVFLDSEFADGASLMTTATPALKDKQTERYYRRVYQWSNAHNLFNEHTRNIDTLSRKHGNTVTIGDSLLSAMIALDKATAAEARIIPR
jgi:hypothetical protein